MEGLGLETGVVDRAARARSVDLFRKGRITLPTFAELAEPATIPAHIRSELRGIDPEAPDPRNLFRVHWHNGADGAELAVPEHLDLPRSLTGVDAHILVALGSRFPLIRAHKALAAYSCLVPRLVTGQFDPTRHRAVWPSTGNYCRGGVAISRILGCRGVAVLPEGMSRERFTWLARWVTRPEDVITTPGTESNVKEIYDRCALLEQDPLNFIFNQFREFGNYLGHYLVTGQALENVARAHPGAMPRAFVSASGSAGTLGAGDYLKQKLGAEIVAVEALECPTLLLNGYGAHNIQGIGDKHVPLIHNVQNTDFVAGISDASTDALLALLGTDVGRQYLVERRSAPPEVVAGLASLGPSGICNVLASIKLAKRLRLGSGDALVTVATDGAAMYRTEVEKILAERFPRGLDLVSAGEVFGEHVLGAGVDRLRELSREEKDRIFNLGYFTWVEQQGVSLADFEARRDPAFWRNLRTLLNSWDDRIREFNDESGAGAAR